MVKEMQRYVRKVRTYHPKLILVMHITKEGLTGSSTFYELTKYSIYESHSVFASSHSNPHLILILILIFSPFPTMNLTFVRI